MEGEAVSDYKHELPRMLHKAADHAHKEAQILRVDTPEECDAALHDGWSLLPAHAKGK